MPSWLTTPIAPSPKVAPGRSVEQELTEPQLNQSPGMAALKGFGAGAIQGLRNLTSPLNAALGAADDIPLALGGAVLGKMAPGVLNLLRAAPEAAEGLEGAAGAMSGVAEASPAAQDILNPATQSQITSMYQQANPAFKALQESGAFSGNRTVGAGNLTPHPALGPSMGYEMPSLSDTNPMFATGNEGIVNAAPKPTTFQDPSQLGYASLLAKGGR